MKLILAKYIEAAYGVGSTEIEPSLGIIDSQAKSFLHGNIKDGTRADILIYNYPDPHNRMYLHITVANQSKRVHHVRFATSISQNRKGTISD